MSSKSILLKLSLLLFCFSLLSSALAITPGTGDGYSINGRVKIPRGRDPWLAETRVPELSNSETDELAKTGVLVQRDLDFLENYPMLRSPLMVARGSHSSSLMDIFHCLVRVDVSARNPGKVQAALTENRRGLTELVLEPLREEQYYEVDKGTFLHNVSCEKPNGFDDGIHADYGVPNAQTSRKHGDPEEMKRAQEGVPSLANMLPGTARS
ncbi:unnamed protein product [Camellia sinensis]